MNEKCNKIKRKGGITVPSCYCKHNNNYYCTYSVPLPGETNRFKVSVQEKNVLDDYSSMISN